MLSLKISYGEDLRRISYSRSINFKEIEDFVHQQFGVKLNATHVIKYQDGEGDWITVASQDDWDIIMADVDVIRKTTVRLIVMPKQNSMDTENQGSVKVDVQSAVLALRKLILAWNTENNPSCEMLKRDILQQVDDKSFVSFVMEVIDCQECRSLSLDLMKGLIRGTTTAWLFQQVFYSGEGTVFVEKILQRYSLLHSKLPRARTERRDGGSVSKHSTIVCDGCDMQPIEGTRFMSLMVHNFDLCEECEASEKWEKTHGPFVKIRKHDRNINYSSYVFQGLKVLPRSGDENKSVGKEMEQRLGSRFIEDVNYVDGSIVKPGASFTKQWYLKNDGSCQWPDTCELVHLSGERFNFKCSLPIPLTEVGEMATISVELFAPREPGRYIGYWSLADKGEKFGDRLWVDLIVDDESGINLIPALPSLIEPDIAHVESQTTSIDQTTLEAHQAVEVLAMETGLLPASTALETSPQIVNDDLQQTLENSPFENLMTPLQSMGFGDVELNRRLLMKYEGNLDATIDALLALS